MSEYQPDRIQPHDLYGYTVHVGDVGRIAMTPRRVEVTGISWTHGQPRPQLLIRERGKRRMEMVDPSTVILTGTPHKEAQP